MGVGPSGRGGTSGRGRGMPGTVGILWVGGWGMGVGCRRWGGGGRSVLGLVEERRGKWWR